MPQVIRWEEPPVTASTNRSMWAPVEEMLKANKRQWALIIDGKNDDPDVVRQSKSVRSYLKWKDGFCVRQWAPKTGEIRVWAKYDPEEAVKSRAAQK